MAKSIACHVTWYDEVPINDISLTSHLATLIIPGLVYWKCHEYQMIYYIIYITSYFSWPILYLTFSYFVCFLFDVFFLFFGVPTWDPCILYFPFWNFWKWLWSLALLPSFILDYIWLGFGCFHRRWWDWLILCWISREKMLSTAWKMLWPLIW